jgi:hypothetical protein
VVTFKLNKKIVTAATVQEIATIEKTINNTTINKTN